MYMDMQRTQTSQSNFHKKIAERLILPSFKLTIKLQ